MKKKTLEGHSLQHESGKEIDHERLSQMKETQSENDLKSQQDAENNLNEGSELKEQDIKTRPILIEQNNQVCQTEPQ